MNLTPSELAAARRALARLTAAGRVRNMDANRSLADQIREAAADRSLTPRSGLPDAFAAIRAQETGAPSPD